MTRAFPSAVLFVDLDGTLILDNSFHSFLRAIWTAGGISLKLTLVHAFGLRLLGPLAGGHAGMKRRVLTAFSKIDSEKRSSIVSATIEQIERTISAPVNELINRWKDDGAEVVLATAAPGCYAIPFAQKLGMAGCLATASIPDPDWQDLMGETKASACRDWIRRRGIPTCTRIGAATDHLDDLPILRLATEAALQVDPARFGEMAAQLGNLALLEHIDPISAEPDGGIWLWLDDRPIGPIDEWDVRMTLSKHRYALIYRGAGCWRTIQPGDPIGPIARRRSCPLPPSSRTRLAIAAKRRLFRDMLGIFH